MDNVNILIVLTSHSDLGDSGKKTGYWKEEFAAPYYTLLDAGASITLASPKGGLAPVDPNSEDASAATDATRRLDTDAIAQQALSNTTPLNKIKVEDYDAVFYPGGHGPLWDLYQDRDSLNLIESFIAAGKPVSAVCHASAALLKAKDNNKKPLLEGIKVTGFSNEEESAVGLSEIVPYLLEDELTKVGGIYQSASLFSPFVVQDNVQKGLIITGQNPASSEPVAQALLKALEENLQPA